MTGSEREGIVKNLIIYFSRSGENYVDGEVKNLSKGNTQVAAEIIRNAVGGDLFEIRPVKTYPADYMKCTEVAKEEQKKNARPELQEYLADVKDYDNIIVAAPCWWGSCPCAVLTQLEQLDLKGKKIYPVMTHEGSGLGSFPRTLKKSCKGAKIQKGLAIHGAEVESSADIITAWAKRHIV